MCSVIERMGRPKTKAIKGKGKRIDGESFSDVSVGNIYSCYSRRDGASPSCSSLFLSFGTSELLASSSTVSGRRACADCKCCSFMDSDVYTEEAEEYGVVVSSFMDSDAWCVFRESFE